MLTQIFTAGKGKKQGGKKEMLPTQVRAMEENFKWCLFRSVHAGVAGDPRLK